MMLTPWRTDLVIAGTTEAPCCIVGADTSVEARSLMDTFTVVEYRSMVGMMLVGSSTGCCCVLCHGCDGHLIYGFCCCSYDQNFGCCCIVRVVLAVELNWRRECLERRSWCLLEEPA